LFKVKLTITSFTKQWLSAVTLVLAIAEDIPENWRDSIPVVLQTLQAVG
jgi:hypothetical protein